jgi:hypothetical protein
MLYAGQWPSHGPCWKYFISPKYVPRSQLRLFQSSHPSGRTFFIIKKIEAPLILYKFNCCLPNKWLNHRSMVKALFSKRKWLSMNAKKYMRQSFGRARKAKNNRINFFYEVWALDPQGRAVIVSLVKTTITGSKSAYCILPKPGTKATMRSHSTISFSRRGSSVFHRWNITFACKREKSESINFFMQEKANYSSHTMQQT